MGVHPPSEWTTKANRQPYELQKAGRLLVERYGFVSRYYPAEKLIRDRDEREARSYLIESGWGMLYQSLPDGDRQIVELPIAGDLVGHFTDRSLRQETFASVTDLRVWEGPATQLSAALAHNSPSADFLHRAIARQRAMLGERMADIGRRGAALRTTHFLLELGVRLECAGVGKRHDYNCPLTQNMLADALGLTAIHLNRTLRETRETGIFQFRRGHVSFMDYAAAIAFAGFDPSYIAG